MLTDKDVQKLKGVFVTKADLKSLATKVDIKLLRGDIRQVRDDIALHDKKFNELAEAINERPTTDEMRAIIDRTYNIALLQTEHDRIKRIIKDKLQVEV